jgi:hypothetical protein
MVVKAVRAFVLGSREREEKAGGAADCHSQGAGHWIVSSTIANPMSVFPKYQASRTSWGINALGSVVCEVELNSGVVGVGVSIGLRQRARRSGSPPADVLLTRCGHAQEALPHATSLSSTWRASSRARTAATWS